VNVLFTDMEVAARTKLVLLQQVNAPVCSSPEDSLFMDRSTYAVGSVSFELKNAEALFISGMN
jgi:hypothetical protein